MVKLWTKLKMFDSKIKDKTCSVAKKIIAKNSPVINQYCKVDLKTLKISEKNINSLSSISRYTWIVNPKCSSINSFHKNLINAIKYLKNKN